MKQQLIYWKEFVGYIFARFNADKCSSVAAELTVTSLLALVPLTTVVFSLLALIPNFQNMAIQLQELMFEYFVPATGESVQNYLTEFVGKAKGMSGVGFLMLLITALLMMKTIDGSFNNIWRIKSHKSALRTILVYWAVLTLGPIFLGTSLLITSYIKSLPLISDVVQQNTIWMRLGLPFLMEVGAFTLMFYIIPNRKIQMKHAVISAGITALFFELAKSGFGIFVDYFSTYQLIFGALATIPLFLIWIYLSWAIILFGAEICHGIFSFESTDSKKANHPFINAVQLILFLGEKQSKGEVIDENSILSNMEFGYRDSNITLLEKLLERDVVAKLQDQSYCLKVGREDINFKTVYVIAGNDLPSIFAVEESALPEKTKQSIIEIISGLDSTLSTKLVR